MTETIFWWQAPNYRSGWNSRWALLIAHILQSLMREGMCPQFGWTCRKAACVCTQTLKHCHMLSVSIASLVRRPRSVARNLIWRSFTHKMTTLSTQCVFETLVRTCFRQFVKCMFLAPWRVGDFCNSSEVPGPLQWASQPVVLTHRTKWLQGWQSCSVGQSTSLV